MYELEGRRERKRWIPILIFTVNFFFNSLDRARGEREGIFSQVETRLSRLGCFTRSSHAPHCGLSVHNKTYSGISFARGKRSVSRERARPSFCKCGRRKRGIERSRVSRGVLYVRGFEILRRASWGEGEDARGFAPAPVVCKKYVLTGTCPCIIIKKQRCEARNTPGHASGPRPFCPVASASRVPSVRAVRKQL